MADNYKIFLFMVIFVVTTGVVAIGILLSYNLNRSFKKNFLQTLLYHQVFSFSFLLYGAWGRIFLVNVLSRFDSKHVVIESASIYIPALGLPFIIIGWFMLIRFFFETRGFNINKHITISYFVFYILLVATGGWMANTGTFLNYKNPEIFFLRLLVCLNLFSNLVILYPLYFKRASKTVNGINLRGEWILLYLSVVVIYSGGTWFVKTHYSIAAASILLMFIGSALIPFFTYLHLKKHPLPKSNHEMDFPEFCEKYEISKREAEIIKEICSGKSNQAIADSLYITLQTVKDHTHRIYTKTGVKNRIHLANLVREQVVLK